MEGPYPYVWLDATYVKARQDGRVGSVAGTAAILGGFSRRVKARWGLSYL